MATCVCGAGKAAGWLKATYSEGSCSYTYDAPPGQCNPMNCSNTACKNNICAQARTGFCQRCGKPCPDGKGGTIRKCYINGVDPCPTCSQPPIDRAKAADFVADNIANTCGMGPSDRARFRDIVYRGYPSSLDGIVSARNACSLSLANQRIQVLANYVRCKWKCDAAIRPKCDKNIPGCTGNVVPTCTGDPGGPIDCTAWPGSWGNCFGAWFKDICHVIPIGGCDPAVQTAMFFGVIG